MAAPIPFCPSIYTEDTQTTIPTQYNLAFSYDFFISEGE